nr:hypothetical protein [Tanacetum cinerariifolium]
MSDHEDETITAENAPPKNIPQITTVTNIYAKFPYLKKGEYDIWAIKMQNFISSSDFLCWNIVLKGNSAKTMTTDQDGTLKIRPPVTTEEHQQNAIKARFGGNVESKKMQKSLLKQKFEKFKVSEEEGLDKGYDKMQKILSQMNTLKIKPEPEDVNMKFLRGLPPSWSGIALILKTIGGLEYISFNDLYNKLKFLEIDTKGYSSSSFTVSNAAFVSTVGSSQGNLSYHESGNGGYSTTISASPGSSSSKGSSNSKCSVVDDVIYSFFATHEIDQQLVYEDLDQMNKEDFKEYDLKHQMAMLSIKSFKIKKDVKRYSRKDLLSCNNYHLGETSGAYVCNDAMHVSCNSRMNDLLDDNNFFIFDDESVRISPVSKMPFRKKPCDSMIVRSKNCPDLSLDHRFGMFKAYDGLEPGLIKLNEMGKSSNPSVSKGSKASKKDLEDLFQDFYDEYFDSSKLMKSSTTNVETPINEEVFHEVSESFQGEYSSSSLNDDVQQCPEEANPNEHHMSAVKRIFCYLKRTINLGLWYPKDSGFDLTAYSDADHAGCHLDRKTESKYVVVSSCCAQVLWMRTHLTDYGLFYDKVPIYCDSKSAIAISCNLVHHTRTKHVDVRVAVKCGVLAYNIKKCFAENTTNVCQQGRSFRDPLSTIEKQLGLQVGGLLLQATITITIFDLSVRYSDSDSDLDDNSDEIAEEKKTQKIDRLARSLLIQGLPNDIYSLIDRNDLWDALERQMRGSEYVEQDKKAAILYEYETFKSTEGEHLLDTYLRYL